MYKIVVLLKRKQGTDIEAFAHQWQQRGARFTTQLPLRRYVQSTPLTLAYKHEEPPCDGVEEFWFEDEAAAHSCLRNFEPAQDKSSPNFVAATALSMAVEEFVVTDGAPSPQAVKSVILVQRKAGMTQQEFFDYWQHHHAKVAARLPGVQRYEQNPLLSASSDTTCDGLSLVWFESLDTLKAATRSPAYADALQDETNFLEYGGRLPIVLTHEQVVIAR